MRVGPAGALAVGMFTLAGPAAAFVLPQPAPGPVPGVFRAGEAFTFLFLSIGPAHAIPTFAALTAGREARFKRTLAFAGTAAAALAIALAATIGVNFLDKWHVSLPALAFTAGLLLLLVALRQLLGGAHEAHPSPTHDGPPPRIVDLAFSPIAVPTIIPPFGMAIVVLLFALAAQRGATMTLAMLVLVILALDLLAMVSADRILKLSALRYGLILVGMILGVLQVALAVQVIADATRDLGII